MIQTIIDDRFTAREQGFSAVRRLREREKCELSLTEINKISHILLAAKLRADYHRRTDTR